MSSNIIIGGGIMGLLCARALSRQKQSVLLLEQGAVSGREASWAGGGIGSPTYPWRQPAAGNLMTQRGVQLYAALAKELQQETGIDIGWQQCGMLVLNCKEKIEAQNWAQHTKQKLEILTAAQVKQIEPQLHCVSDQNFWLPEIPQVRNPRLLKALQISLAQAPIVQIKTNCKATGFILYNGEVSSVQTEQGIFTADRIIITTGAWTAYLLQKLGVEINIFPVRGQILLWELPKKLLSAIVADEAHYLIPRKDNYLLAGGTRERAGFNKSTTAEAYADIYENAIRLLPELNNAAVVQHWSGLRPGSLNEIPYVGKIPGVNNVWINAGHYANGLNMAPAATELLLDLMFENKPKLAAELYQWPLQKSRM